MRLASMSSIFLLFILHSICWSQPAKALPDSEITNQDSLSSNARSGLLWHVGLGLGGNYAAIGANAVMEINFFSLQVAVGPGFGAGLRLMLAPTSWHVRPYLSVIGYLYFGAGSQIIYPYSSVGFDFRFGGRFGITLDVGLMSYPTKKDVSQGNVDNTSHNDWRTILGSDSSVPVSPIVFSLGFTIHLGSAAKYRIADQPADSE